MTGGRPSLTTRRPLRVEFGAPLAHRPSPRGAPRPAFRASSPHVPIPRAHSSLALAPRPSSFAHSPHVPHASRPTSLASRPTPLVPRLSPHVPRSSPPRPSRFAPHPRPFAPRPSSGHSASFNGRSVGCASSFDVGFQLTVRSGRDSGRVGTRGGSGAGRGGSGVDWHRLGPAELWWEWTRQRIS